MKQFLFCVALIAFLATNASGGNQYQTDQLRTCYVTHASPQIMPVNFISQPTVTPVAIGTLPVTQTTYAYRSIVETDGWMAPKWIPSLAISCNTLFVNFDDSGNTYKIPILTHNRYLNLRKPNNYNVDASYGLKY